MHFVIGCLCLFFPNKKNSLRLSLLPKTSKSKSTALKSVDDVNVGGFDDELSATEIAYLVKNFRNFLRNNNRKERDKNTVEPKNFRKNDPTKVNNTEKPGEKVGQSSNNSTGP